MRDHVTHFIVCNFLWLASLNSMAQSDLLTNAQGMRVRVVQKDFPLLKVLLPGQSDSERGIEIEFPEHITGIKFEHQPSRWMFIKLCNAPGTSRSPHFCDT